MANVFPSAFKTAAQAEGLTAAQAKTLRDVLAPLLQSVVAWATDPAQAQGFNDAALKAGFTELQALSDAQLHAAMRIVAGLTDAVYVP